MVFSGRIFLIYPSLLLKKTISILPLSSSHITLFGKFLILGKLYLDTLTFIVVILQIWIDKMIKPIRNIFPDIVTSVFFLMICRAVIATRNPSYELSYVYYSHTKGTPRHILLRPRALLNK